MTVQDGAMVIRGKRVIKVPPTARPLILGLPAGTIEERLRLPRAIDLRQVEGRPHNGILKVRLPKPVMVRLQRIPVRVA